MKLQVPQLDAARMAATQVQVGEVRVGPVKVGRLRLRGAKATARSGRIQLRHTRLALALAFALDWTVGITIDVPDPWPDVVFERSGVLQLGSMALAIGFGHVAVPGLAALKIDLADAEARNVTAVVGALKNLSLGPLLAERLRARGTVLPRAGFDTPGLALGNAVASGLGLPALDIAGIEVGRAAGGAVPLPSLTVPGIALPPVLLPEVALGPVAAMSRPIVTTLPEANAVLLKAALRVTTTASLLVDELRIEQLGIGLEVGEAVLENVTLPWEVLDLKLAQLGIETLAVPRVEVG